MTGDDQGTEELLLLTRSLMDRYVAARAEPFRNHDLHGTIRAIADWFRQANVVRSRPTLKVKASLGMGNWAVVPSIAFLDSRETGSTSDGVYVIILFRGDTSGFYVTLNQGITKPVEFVGRSKARALLRERAALIRERFPQLATFGFDIHAPPEMRALGKFQELSDSTIAHWFFAKEDSNSGPTLLTAIERLLEIYNRYLESPIPIDADRTTWIRNKLR